MFKAAMSVGGMLAGLALVSVPATALAQCCAPPPPCCTAPTPPPPPSTPCCSAPGHSVNVPSVNVYVAPSVVVNASASAYASSVANASAGASSGSMIFYGGGGSRFSSGPGAPGLIQNLRVEGGARRTAYSASRTRIRTVVLQAVCIDDRNIPHAASQVSPNRDVSEGFEGELYRCIAGTRMQWTLADYDGKISFDKGQTVTCAKKQALYHAKGGIVECRAERPARDCNERSLLRRFGAGVKILKIITIETYQAYREEASSQEASMSLSLDGGVGGVVY
jgi:hypothetical protein